MPEIRLIDAIALLKKLQEQQKYSSATDSRGRAKAIVELIHAPTADAVPVKRGKWICVNDDENVWMCDNCGDELAFEVGDPDSLEMFFCPHCGADMRGDTDA